MNVKCGKCDGKGWNTDDNICRVCGGVGSVDLPSNAVKCGKCDGKGWNIDDNTCTACKGTGWGIPKKFY